MRGPAGLIASALLPFLRLVTARLEAVSAPATEKAHSNDETTLSSLRKRYPDAPQAWLDLLARRLGDGGDLQVAHCKAPDVGKALDVSEPPAKPLYVVAAKSSRSGEPEPSLRNERKRDSPAAKRLPLDFPRTGSAGPRSPSGFPQPASTAPPPGRSRRAGITVKEATTRAGAETVSRGADTPERKPVAIGRFVRTKEASVEQRAAPQPNPVAAPRPPRPILRLLPERAPITTPIEYKDGNARREALAPGSLLPAQPFAAPASAPHRSEPVWPHAPAAPSRRRESAKRPAPPPLAAPRLRFDPSPREAAREQLFVVTPPVDRWPDLPTTPTPPAVREPDDGERLRQLIQDQVERAWNG
ncbi:MAG: hypothetical protein Q8M31_01715 [Beijerinckiaceae bacterium]|nr:hypothetical protein [Beijerinckiaceae bacterium]